MSKYFCPKCSSLTFALRYQTGGNWYKIGQQFCAKCKITIKEKECIKGLEELNKKRR